MSYPHRQALALACSLLLMASDALGAAGDPDLSFGTGGFVITEVGDMSEAYDLVRQPDGKLVVAGFTEEEGFSTVTRILVARYLSDGTLDSAFADGGIAITDTVPGFASRGRALLLQPDGALIAVGFASPDHYWDAGGDVVLVRYLADGSLDPTFGSGGVVVTDVFGFPDQGSDALLQPDGRIVVAGFTRPTSPSASQDALIARYDGDGTLDEDFGTGGIVTFDLGGRIERARGVALQADGAIVITGGALDPADQAYGPSSGFIARFDSTGAPDPGFGDAGGYTELSLDYRTYLDELVQLPSGDLLSRGSYSADGIYGHSFLARFDADGGLDLGFGDGDGILDPAPGLFFGFGLAPSGAVYGTGPGFLWGHWYSMGVTRFDADGAADPNFGAAGRAALWLGPGTTNSGGTAVVAEPDGSRVTIAGFRADGPVEYGLGEPRQIALARFHAVSPACSGDGDCDACEHCSAGVCVNGPRTTCERPTSPWAMLTYAGGPVMPRIQWKWKSIAAPVDFDPGAEAIGLCMWWGERPVYESSVPPGAGWKTAPNGLMVFRDKTRSHAGIEKIKIGRSLEVKAHGPNVADNPNGFADALLQPADDTIWLHVQLNAESGKCFAASYPQTAIPGKYPSHKRKGIGY